MIVHALVLASTWSHQTTRRVLELGLLAGLVGAVVVALSFGRRLLLFVGGMLVALGFGLAILAVHFGVSPFRP